MTHGGSAAHWRRIAQERLRALWIIAHGHGGRVAVGKTAAEQYPGDKIAEVWTHTDPSFGDFIIEARRGNGEEVREGSDDVSRR